MFNFKTLTAAVVAAVGLGAVTTTPAQAQNGEIARFLAGAAAVAIIVDAANRNQQRHRVEKRYVYVPAPRPRHHRREVIVQRGTVTVVRPGDRRDHRRWERRADRRDWRRIDRRDYYGH